jgi:hypothetical protein
VDEIHKNTFCFRGEDPELGFVSVHDCNCRHTYDWLPATTSSFDGHHNELLGGHATTRSTPAPTAT